MKSKCLTCGHEADGISELPVKCPGCGYVSPRSVVGDKRDDAARVAARRQMEIVAAMLAQPLVYLLSSMGMYFESRAHYYDARTAKFGGDIGDDDIDDDDEQSTPTEHGPMCPCDRCKMERAQ